MTRRPGAWLRRSSRDSGSSPAQHERAVEALVAAADGGDVRALTRMLHPGVVLTVDGGGVVAAPVAALEGASDVAAYLADVLLDTSATLRVESVNGLPGIVVCRDGRVRGVLSLRTRGRRIVEAWLVVNPQKLTHWTC